MNKFINSLLKNSKKYKPLVTIIANQTITTRQSLRSRAKYLLPTILIGAIIYENHERFFSLFGMSQSRLKKGIDRWKGVEELEKTIDLNLSDLVKYSFYYFRIC
jgi:hypothetical protein